MTADEYIERYGSSLSESQKRYIEAFGAPASASASGPARNPSTPGLRIADAPEESHGARMARLDAEAGF